MTEDQWRPKVVARLRKEVGGEWFIYPRTRYGTAGVSDILGCVKGRFVAIELKSPTPTKKASDYGATPAQRAFLERVRKAGGHEYLIWNEYGILFIIEEIQSWPI